MSVEMHVQEARDAFLLQLEADGRSRHTLGQYRRHVTALATWLATTGKTNVADLRPEVLAKFFAADVAKNSCRGGAKKAVSLNAMRTSIRCFAKHLHDAGLVATNPARMLRRARCAPPPPKALHADEQKRLLDVLTAATGIEGGRDKMLIELLLGTGVRIGSALALDVPDIDFGHNEIVLRRTKNDRPCTVVMPASIAEKLKGFVAARTNGPVFMANKHRISVRHAQRRLTEWFKAAGVRGRSAHSLRHSFATNLLARTGDLRLVQAALCHSSVVSTTVYAQVDLARLRAAVGA